MMGKFKPSRSQQRAQSRYAQDINASAKRLTAVSTPAAWPDAHGRQRFASFSRLETDITSAVLLAEVSGLKAKEILDRLRDLADQYEDDKAIELAEASQ